MPRRLSVADRAMHVRLLQMAERHVAEGERRIAEQEHRIHDLARRGHDVTMAKGLLDEFCASQDLFIQHRDDIQKALEP